MQNDERAIREVISTWMSATRAGDIDTVLRLMTDDVIFLQPGQPPMDKAGFAKAAKPQSEGAMKFEGHSDIQEIKVLGDWAFMWTKLKVTVTPAGGATMTRSGTTLSVLRKENGKWKLARDANLLGPPEKQDA